MDELQLGFLCMQGGFAALTRRGEGTRLAVLALLLEHPTASRQRIGEVLGITSQAVSAQVAELRQRGWIGGEDSQPTPAGIQALSEGVAGLRRALEALQRPLASLGTVSAQARCGLRAGQHVGLWMVDGDLVADEDLRAGSKGIARTDADTGSEVVVGSLSGVVELRPGLITVARLPGPSEGGTGGIDAKRVRLLVPDGVRVGAVGTGARILAEQTGRLDYPFGAEAAALNAAARGVDTFLWVSSDRMAEVLGAMDVEGTRVRVLDASA